MTRREFLRRSAPLIAAGAVTPWFVEAIARRLFGPRRFWDMGAAAQKAAVCRGVDYAVGEDQTALVVIKTRDRGEWETQFAMDFRVHEVSLVKNAPHGHRFEIVKPVG